MTYLGKKKIAHLAPKHPFALEQITFIQNSPTLSKPLLTGRNGVTITVSWGYEMHSLRIGATRWRHIRQGKMIMSRSIGWYEGQSFKCRWYFNQGEHTLEVCYGDDGAQGFIGDISDAMIEERVR